MLYVVALRHFGATGAAIVARADKRGVLLRVGSSTDADLRLRGAGEATAELFCDGSDWWIREPREAPRIARDGAVAALGPWTLLLLEGGDDEFADGDGDRSGLPRFSCAGDEVAMPDDGAPAILGASPWCALRLRALELPVVGVARRDREGRVRIYPIPGVDLRRRGDRLAAAAVLHDGDQLQCGGPNGEPVAYVDPHEQLDRLLGMPRAHETTDQVDGAAPSRWRPDVTLFEVALWSVALGALVGYALLAWSRW